MTHQIDLAEVEAMLATRRKAIEADLEGDSEEAVIARNEVEVAHAMTIWRTKEANRGTNPKHIIEAMIRNSVASIAGQLLQSIRSPDDQASAAVGICQEMLLHMLKIISATEEERAKYSRVIKATDGGAA